MTARIQCQRTDVEMSRSKQRSV